MAHVRVSAPVRVLIGLRLGGLIAAAVSAVWVPVMAAGLSAQGNLPSGAELASRVINALDRVRTAQLTSNLPNGHHTEIRYVAPDRVGMIEWDERDQEYARYVLIGDTGYTIDASAAGSCRRVRSEGIRTQTQVFRPLRAALTLARPVPLADGGEVERVDVAGRTALHAAYTYGPSPELEELGLRRSGSTLLDLVVDPEIWLPLSSVEEIPGAVTEILFLAWDRPISIEPPSRC